MLDEVEAAVLLVAASVLRGEGFTYTLPSRAKGNQLYVPGGRGVRSCPRVQRATSCTCGVGAACAGLAVAGPAGRQAGGCRRAPTRTALVYPGQPALLASVVD